MEHKKMSHATRNESSNDADELKVKSLVDEHQSGDANAFPKIVKMYKTQVVALAYKMVNDYDEAADVAQIVFVKMSRNLWRYDRRRKFYTWLYRITVNASIDYIRKNKRHYHEQLDNYHNAIESNVYTPERNFRNGQLREELSQAADRLNDKQRSAFLLRDVQGCRVDDVADIMEIPEATVRWYLHRARTKIRKDLLRRCPHLLILAGIR